MYNVHGVSSAHPPIIIILLAINVIGSLNRRLSDLLDFSKHHENVRMVLYSNATKVMQVFIMFTPKY